MKLATWAKLYAFASLSLIMLLFMPSSQSAIYSRVRNPAHRQILATKLLHSYAYRQYAPQKSIQAWPAISTSNQPARSNLQTVEWRGQSDPVLQRFLRMITDGDGTMIKGIYAPGKFALEVVQQPKGDWTFVSQASGVVTQFQSASNPVTGLLAHNYLEGQRFYDLSVGEEIDLLFGNGSTRHYLVSGIYQYQKLDTNSLSSDMIDLGSGKRVTTGDVFRLVYTGNERITLQTCLEGEGISNWGLYFVIAQPISNIQ